MCLHVLCSLCMPPYEELNHKTILSDWYRFELALKWICLSCILLVFQVCLAARLCQGHRVVQHALERGLKLCQMMTGWVLLDQEVLEALVDREDPGRQITFNICSA